MNKKFLLTTILLLTMVVCPALSQDIVGTWKCISSYDVVEGKELTNYMKGQYLTVNADGTYTSTSDEMGYGSYTFQGNQFSAKNNKGAKFTATVSVDGNNLTMEGSSSYGVSFTYVFERVDQIDIVGTWKCISSYDVVEDKELTNYMKGQYLTVNADGTYTSTSDEMGYGSYTFQGNQFSAKNNKGAKFTATVSVDGNNLTMEGSSSYGVSFTYVFERVDQIDIVGTWKCISSYDLVEGKEITDYMKGQYLTVNADGTYTSTSKEMGHGTYSFGGNSFVAQNNLGVTFTATLFVSSDQLTMEGRSSSGVTFQYVFEKSSGEPEPSPGGKVETKRTIHVATAGTLRDIIPIGEKYQIEELTLTGELNGTDFNYIREMTGDSVYLEHYDELLHFTTNGKLRKLDISEAQIVDGGDRCIYVYDSADREFLVFPTLANTIHHYQFSGYNLKEIILPNNVTSIGSSAFGGCSELTFITIPSSVTHINSSAFSGCSGLTSIIVEAGNAVYDSRDNCNAIIETASNTLIIGCQNTIIPNSVTSIGLLAFGGCNTLMDVYCYAETVPKTDRYAFGYDDTPISNAILHVPAGSISSYQNAEPWCYFKEIVPLDGSGVQAIEADNRVIQINSIRGEKLETPSKGINIIKMKDGTTKKILVK